MGSTLSKCAGARKRSVNRLSSADCEKKPLLTAPVKFGDDTYFDEKQGLKAELATDYGAKVMEFTQQERDIYRIVKERMDKRASSLKNLILSSIEPVEPIKIQLPEESSYKKVLERMRGLIAGEFIATPNQEDPSAVAGLPDDERQVTHDIQLQNETRFDQPTWICSQQEPCPANVKFCSGYESVDEDEMEADGPRSAEELSHPEETTATETPVVAKPHIDLDLRRKPRFIDIPGIDDGEHIRDLDSWARFDCEEDLADYIVDAILTVKKSGDHFATCLNDIVQIHFGEEWFIVGHIAEEILNKLVSAMRDIGIAEKSDTFKNAYKLARSAAYNFDLLTWDRPFEVDVVPALGILRLLVPWVVEELGYYHGGPPKRGFAAEHQKHGSDVSAEAVFQHLEQLAKDEILAREADSPRCADDEQDSAEWLPWRGSA